MKTLKYNFCTKVNRGTEEAPAFEELLSPVKMTWNEVNEEIAREEAYQGEYTIEDDGMEEPAQPTQEQRIGELEEALDMILSGVTE